MSTIVRAIVCFLAVLMGLPGLALPALREHSKWLDLPLERLIAMADKDFTDGGSKDTALMCYTIVANRYEQSMSLDHKRHCKDANMRLWSIYFYDFYDYPKCFDCLTRAQEIATQAGIEDANIYLGFGCMYQTISEECGNYELGTTALDYYRQALAVGLRTHDDEHTDMACTDVLSMSYAQGGLDQTNSMWSHYLQLPEDNATWILRRYNKMLYQALKSVEHKQYDQAIANYPIPKCMRVLAVIEDYDFKGKGGAPQDTEDRELFLEMVSKILVI